MTNEAANADRAPRIEETDLTPYDFFDFGSSEGNSVEFARSFLGGRSGLGIDLDPEKVSIARQRGFDCVIGDLSAMQLPPNCVNFVIINHVLEHLPDLETAEKIVANAVHAARDFVFIKGPWFDADDYLAELGLKFYWSDWAGHTLHLTSSMLSEILKQLSLSETLLLGHDPILTSEHSAIHPIGAPRDRHEYHLEYGHKSHIQFSKPLFRDVACIIKLDGKALRASRFAWSSNLHRITVENGVRQSSPLASPLSWITARRKTRGALRRLRNLWRGAFGRI